MKRIYTILLSLMAFLVPQLASAASFTLNIDDASHVTAKISSIFPLSLNNGSNTISITGGGMPISITTKAGYAIESVTYTKTPLQWKESSTSISFLAKADFDGAVITIKTKADESQEIPKFTVNVDNAENVKLSYSGLFPPSITLVNGTNVLDYHADFTRLNIQPQGEASISEIKVNGVVNTTWDARTNPFIQIKAKDVIDITTTLEKPVAVVNITYTGECEGVISGVKINGNETALSNPLNAKVDDKIELICDTDAFDNISVENDSDNPAFGIIGQMNKGVYSFTVTATKTTLNISATRVRHDVTVNIVDPTHLTLYRGLRDGGEEIADLKEGDNTVSFRVPQNTLDIAPKQGYILKSVLHNDAEKLTADGIQPIEIRHGDKITIVTEQDPSVGVNEIANEAANAPVYNLQGIRVASRAALTSLPSGIYILNGKKVIIK